MRSKWTRMSCVLAYTRLNNTCLTIDFAKSCQHACSRLGSVNRNTIRCLDRYTHTHPDVLFEQFTCKNTCTVIMLHQVTRAAQQLETHTNRTSYFIDLPRSCSCQPAANLHDKNMSNGRHDTLLFMRFHLTSKLYKLHVPWRTFKPKLNLV